MEDGYENKSTTNDSDFARQVCRKHGQSFENLHTFSDFSESSDDDYIDIDVGSAMFWEAASRKLNPQTSESIEFEFHAKVMEDLDFTGSPADELFYKGRLVPLQLPPRIEMVEEVLGLEKSPHQTGMTLLGQYAQSRSVLSMDSRDSQAEALGEGLIHIGLNMDSEFFTPYESDEARSYDSFEPSKELCSDLYKEKFMSCDSMNQAEVEASSSEPKRKNNRFNIIKKAKKLLDCTHISQSSLASKLNASRAYVKSLLSKTARIKGTTPLNQKDLFSSTTDYPDHNIVSRGYLNCHMNVLKPNYANKGIGIHKYGYQVSAAVANSVHKENPSMIEYVSRTKSFSDYLCSMMETETHNSTFFCYSNPLSPNVNGAILKGCGIASLETEDAVQGAIAHCKESVRLASNKSISGS